MLALLWTYGAVAAGQNELRVGSVAMDIPAVMYKRLSPLTDYLSRELQQPVTLKLSPNMAGAIDALVKGDVDIAYLTPVAYLHAHDRGQARVVVKMLTNNSSTFKLVIVVREDSAIRRVADLRGKQFAFGDKAAVLQRAVVVNAGLPLDTLGGYRFIGHYDNIARGVVNGDFDGGIVKDTTAIVWRGKGLREIYSSPDLPPYNISASGKVSEETVKRLRRAFLKLDAKHPQYRDIIHAIDPNYDGFAPGDDRDYEVVRRLVAPFASE
jgi:phosphonate transport system substrate-binding protein